MNEYERAFREIMGLPEGVPTPRDSLMWLYRAEGHFGRSLSATISREQMVRRLAWAIPTDEALATIAKYGPLVELGAGTGYWASLLRERGVDVVAYDLMPVDGAVVNGWHKYTDNESALHVVDEDGKIRWAEGPLPPIVPFTTVLHGDAGVLRKHPDRSLFLCWPPYDTSMASDALKNWRGEHLIYIGEGYGGCNANDSFFRRVRHRFEEVEDIDLPQWPGIHDGLYVYRRRERKR